METKRRDRMAAAAGLCLCLLLSLLAVYGIEAQKLAERRDRTRYITSAEVSKLQYVLDTLLLKTQTLEMLVVENGGKVERFERVAEALCDNPAIRSLQLAPDGVVTDVYPLEGNENAFVDLFHTPERATEAIEARDSGRMTLSGPFELYQGGFGVIGRRPVYLPDGAGGQNFWGFTIIVLDLPDAFAPARLDIFVKEGFEYKLYRAHPDTGERQIIGESSGAPLVRPEEIAFSVPNGTWTFCVMPRGGWVRRGDVALEIAVAAVVSLLAALLLAFVLQLRREKERFYRFSITDSLTGLYNYSRLMAVLGDYSAGKHAFALFFMDLDGFKSVNDQFGHNAGNQVLIESARRISACFGKGCDVFRNGGDEFCAVLPGGRDEVFCGALAARIAESVGRPFSVDEGDVRCGVSIGFARFPDDRDSLEELLQEADRRMYRDKSQKRKARGGLNDLQREESH